MHRDHTRTRLMHGLAPLRHPDPMVQLDLTAPGRGCGEWAPKPAVPTSLPYRCSRTPGHPGPHVAATALDGTYIAEWDDNRDTDDTT